MKKFFLFKFFIVFLALVMADILPNGVKTKTNLRKIKPSSITKNEVKKSKNSETNKTTITEKMDFTPDYKEEFSEYSQQNSIEYVKVEKKEIIKEVKIKTNTKKESNIVEKNTDQKLIEVADESKMELSYKDIEDQGKIKKINFKPTKVAAFSFTIKNYNKSEVNRKLIAHKETQQTQKKVVAKEKIKHDRISTAASATEKSNPINKKEPTVKQKKALNESDELVFFDYSEDGSVKVDEISNENSKQKIEKMPRIAKTNMENVESPIKHYKGISHKKVGESKKLAEVDLSKIQEQYFSNDKSENNSVIGDEKRDKEDKLKEENQNGFLSDYSCLDESNLTSQVYDSNLRITLDSIDYSKNEYSKIYDFELRFQDDRDDIIQDEANGFIDLSYRLSTKMNIRRGTLYSSLHMPVTLDLAFEGEDAQLNIPTFTTKSFNNIVEDLGVTGLGAHMLVRLNDTTEDVDIDINNKYEAKLFLDEQLKIVNRSESDYYYILFIGLKPGNSVVYFKNNQNQVTSKIVHFSEKEIYFEPNYYTEVLNEELNLYQESLLSKCKSLLDIENDTIESWSYEGNISKEALNTHVVDRMLYPLGTRKYFEFKHVKESIFVGKWSNSPLIIPSEGYIRYVLDQFDINGNECLVQLNLSKPIQRAVYSSKNDEYQNIPKALYLDRDGKFYESSSDETNRIFLMGQKQGIMNIKLDYIDGSSQFIQSYCSNNTYLVEQL